jgi:hypothetical protein
MRKAESRRVRELPAPREAPWNVLREGEGGEGCSSAGGEDVDDEDEEAEGEESGDVEVDAHRGLSPSGADKTRGLKPKQHTRRSQTHSCAARNKRKRELPVVSPPTGWMRAAVPSRSMLTFVHHRW